MPYLQFDGCFGGDEFAAFMQNITDVEGMETNLDNIKGKFSTMKFGQDKIAFFEIKEGLLKYL